MELVTSGAVVHEGDAELERQLGRVVARPLPEGSSVTSGTGETIVAATTAMLVVHCAQTAIPRAPSNKMWRSSGVSSRLALAQPRPVASVPNSLRPPRPAAIWYANAGEWTVSVIETVSGVTSVRLTPPTQSVG